MARQFDRMPWLVAATEDLEGPGPGKQNGQLFPAITHLWNSCFKSRSLADTDITHSAGWPEVNVFSCRGRKPSRYPGFGL